jgi:hypothetical protein
MEHSDTSPPDRPGPVGPAPAASRPGWRASGLRAQLVRAAVPALALTVIAGGAAGTVTLVNLAGDVETSSEADDSPSDDSPAEDGGAAASDEDDASDEAPSDNDVAIESSAADGDDDGNGGASGPLTYEQAVVLHGRPDYAAILTRRYPGAQWSLSGDDPSRLTWSGPGDAPTPDELDAHWPSVAAELAAERAEQEAERATAAAAREAELEARRDDPGVAALLDSFDPRRIWGPNPDYAHVLSRRFPGAQWSLSGNDPVGGLDWMGPGPKPTRAELDAMWAEVAREMALEMDPEELARWAGTGDRIYVEGVLRPKGWVGGANDRQPEPIAVTEDDWRFLPQLPQDGGGGSIDIYKDPTGGRNFEQMYSTSLEGLVRAISEAHGNWGDQYGGLGLSMNGDRTLIWYSSQVDRDIVVSILTSMGALPADRSAPASGPEAEVEAEADEASDASEEHDRDVPSED